MAKLPAIHLNETEVKILVDIAEQLISYLMKKTDLTPEDKDKLISIQDRLNNLRSKEQAIADGK